MTALLLQARAVGLAIHLCGSQLRVEGLDALSPNVAAQWCNRIRARRDEVFTALGGRDDPAGSILRQLGVTVVYSGRSLRPWQPPDCCTSNPPAPTR